MKNTQKKPICSQIYIFKQKSPNAWPVIDIRQLELMLCKMLLQDFVG